MIRKAVSLGILASSFLVASSLSAWAGCFTDLQDCYYEAAREEDAFRRFLMGLDCELEFAGCVREVIF